MKQKVVTKAIIRQDGKILLLRRHGGRPSIHGLYELPGGRIHFKQQPEDALAHALRVHTATALETIQLDRIISFIDPDDRELQYVFIIYNASLKPTDRSIELSQEYDHYVWKKEQDLQHIELTESTLQILGLAPVPFATGKEATIFVADDDKVTSNHVIAYSDGGSRGNPGPSAAGFVMIGDDTRLVCEGGAYLGVTTNNVAEYQALYLGLEKALEIGVRTIDFRLDSQLVVNQMNGIYKVKNAELLPIHNRIKELAQQFDKVSYTHVLREYNTLADGVVNKILDEKQSALIA